MKVEGEAAVVWWATTASWTWMAPLGVPVVPLVKWSERDVLRVGRRDGEPRVGRGHQRAEVARPGQRAARGRVADDEHVLEARKRRAQRLHLPLVERGRW